MTGSAKQSKRLVRGGLDCFVALLLAMTANRKGYLIPTVATIDSLLHPRMSAIAFIRG